MCVCFFNVQSNILTHTLSLFLFLSLCNYVCSFVPVPSVICCTLLVSVSVGYVCKSVSSQAKMHCVSFFLSLLFAEYPQHLRSRSLLSLLITGAWHQMRLCLPLPFSSKPPIPSLTCRTAGWAWLRTVPMACLGNTCPTTGLIIRCVCVCVSLSLSLSCLSLSLSLSLSLYVLLVFLLLKVQTQAVCDRRFLYHQPMGVIIGHSRIFAKVERTIIFLIAEDYFLCIFRFGFSGLPTLHCCVCGFHSRFQWELMPWHQMVVSVSLLLSCDSFSAFILC